MLVSPKFWGCCHQVPFTMSPSGKRPGQSLAATGVPGLVPSRLFFIMDRNQGLRFLVDTGAEVSVLPPTCAERRHPSESLSLQAVNGTRIATYGTRSLTLNLGLRRTLRWVFIVADVQQPILGADFLSHFNLHVDMTHCAWLMPLPSSLSGACIPRHPHLAPLFFPVSLQMTFLLSSLIFPLSLDHSLTLTHPNIQSFTTSKPLALRYPHGLAAFHLSAYVSLAENSSTCWS